MPEIDPRAAGVAWQGGRAGAPARTSGRRFGTGNSIRGYDRGHAKPSRMWRRVPSSRRRGHEMTTGPQAMFVAEYPCDRFCRIEVDLSDAHSQMTLQQMREKADALHQR